MILNLVGNAIKFTKKGEVTLRISSLKDAGGGLAGLRLEVRDTGIGMTREQSQRVFEKFNQGGNDTTRRFGGTGLGLTIAQQIARDLGGDVTVDSQVGEGSEFVATLMCSEVLSADDGESKNATDTPCSIVQTAGVLCGRRILLVEDTADNVILIRHHFRKQGIEIETATNGEHGLRSVLDAERDGQGYELVLMDINMPVMDGIECLTRIREAGCEVPVVMLSAHAMVDEQRRCYDAGASDYCTKPINFELLFNICASLVDDDPSRLAA
jgi:CheY-like chemotaxis protein